MALRVATPSTAAVAVARTIRAGAAAAAPSGGGGTPGAAAAPARLVLGRGRLGLSGSRRGA